MQGVVAWFNNQKGFGFLSRNDGGRDVFVHHTCISMDGYRTLREGQKVEFIVSDGPGGPQADEVKVIG